MMDFQWRPCGETVLWCNSTFYGLFENIWIAESGSCGPSSVLAWPIQPNPLFGKNWTTTEFCVWSNKSAVRISLPGRFEQRTWGEERNIQRGGNQKRQTNTIIRNDSWSQLSKKYQIWSPGKQKTSILAQAHKHKKRVNKYHKCVHCLLHLFWNLEGLRKSRCSLVWTIWCWWCGKTTPRSSPRLARCKSTSIPKNRMWNSFETSVNFVFNRSLLISVFTLWNKTHRCMIYKHIFQNSKDY